jgi:hypothetical protein
VLSGALRAQGGFMQSSRIRLTCVLVLTLLAVSPRFGALAQERAAGQQPADRPASPQTSATGAASPQTGANGPQTPATFRGGINYVRVDAIVTDRKGQPVFDLKQADFEVTEDGKPQTVDSFKLIRVDGNPKPGEPPIT